MKRKGRITRIERENATYATITQGIKKDKQEIYVESNKYKGSNGSYLSNFKSEPHIYLYLCMYETEEYPKETIKIDIRETIINKNNIQKVSSQKLNSIKEKNVGKKVSFDWKDDGSISIDIDQLEL